MIVCRSNICCSLDLQEESCRHLACFSQLPSRPIGHRAPRLPRVLSVSQKSNPFIHAAGRALVKRESQELGGQRNWLLTRLAPTSRRHVYAEPMAESPESVRSRRMQDYRRPLGRFAAAVEKLRLQRQPSRPILRYPTTASTRACARSRSSEAAWGAEGKQWAISPLTLCGAQV
jgi:hypothetical protein